LSELVRKVREDAGVRLQITVREEVVAELRGALPEPKPGAAAKKLLDLMQTLPKPRGKKHDTSRHTREYLYGGKSKR
jgi:antitoxin (DNA-binding transcriptional repressor) of toxin-antitoxin stability system